MIACRSARARAPDGWGLIELPTLGIVTLGWLLALRTRGVRIAVVPCDGRCCAEISDVFALSSQIDSRLRPTPRPVEPARAAGDRGRTRNRDRPAPARRVGGVAARRPRGQRRSLLALRRVRDLVPDGSDRARRRGRRRVAHPRSPSLHRLRRLCSRLSGGRALGPARDRHRPLGRRRPRRDGRSRRLRGLRPALPPWALRRRVNELLGRADDPAWLCPAARPAAPRIDGGERGRAGQASS